MRLRANIEAVTRIRNHVVRRSIEFKDVRFAYPSRPDRAALQGVTLSITAGQKVRAGEDPLRSYYPSIPRTI